MTFSIGVVAHESRIFQAKRLVAMVNADVVMVDGGEQPLGCEANHKRVWQVLSMMTKQDWAVVLEDDAQPVEGFRDQLAAALAVAPADYVSLYLGQGFPRHWQKRYRETLEEATPDTCWAMTGGWMLHAVGIAAKTKLVPAMLAHLDRAVGVPVDQAIGQHCRNTQTRVAYTLPSLVDHNDGPTIHHHQDGQPRTPGRKAWQTGTRTTWTTTQIEMG